MKPTIRLAASLVSATALVAVAVAGVWAEPQLSGPAPVTKSLQGHPSPADDPRLHTLYDTLAAARASGADKVDGPLETKLREAARSYPPLHELDAKAWEDHVVDMGRQMLEIGRKDPKVFQSYDNFVIALRGPQ